MFDTIKKFFQKRSLRQFETFVARINAKEADLRARSNDEIKQASLNLKKEIQKNGTISDEHVVQAFAYVREAASRALNQRPFDVQLVGGLVLHQGAVTEMATGEGKTLSAVAPSYLNALEGKGVHVVTVNEYLARRDAVWMGQIYHLLGLTVGCLVPNGAFIYDPTWRIPEDNQKMIDEARDTTGSFLVQQEYLRPASRREAYQADITYGTNHEFGFDYLRDNLCYSLQAQVQRGHHFAIIDEVDSILIDEARTPLIISAPDRESSELYKTFARIVRNLERGHDYEVEEKFKSVRILEPGIGKIEKMIGVENIYSPENLRLVHYLEESLKAHAAFHKDKDYVVKNGEIVIVDEFTGRLLAGRRYNGGLHQAIEAKEAVYVKEESRTYAKISIQNYFRLYKKISGMTGTAQTSAEEFHKVYGLEVFSIPTNRPVARMDIADQIYKDANAKIKAIVAEIKEKNEKGQPVLVGTASIADNEVLSSALHAAGVPHEVLNAKNNEREGAIIAQAGRLKSVTVATNLAGRGVDIILGGNPPDSAEAKKVRELGGLHVIGTVRHEARRIDNQLRGRAGRQGDPGSSQFYLALDDDLMRIFGGGRITSLMERFNFPEDEPIQMPMVSRAVAEAQSKVEGAHFDSRKHLLEYDDVLNKQRAAVYTKRQEILGSISKETLANVIYEAVRDHLQNIPVSADQPDELPVQSEGLDAEAHVSQTRPTLKNVLAASAITNQSDPFPEPFDQDALDALLRKRSGEIVGDPNIINSLLGILDMLWMTHLDDLEALSESVGLRAYGQRDPLVEYRREASSLYKRFWGHFNEWVCNNIFNLAKLSAQQQSSGTQPAAPKPAVIIPQNVQQSAGGASQTANPNEKIGRNDPCPCGSGKKYKRCHGV